MKGSPKRHHSRKKNTGTPCDLEGRNETPLSVIYDNGQLETKQSIEPVIRLKTGKNESFSETKQVRRNNHNQNWALHFISSPNKLIALFSTTIQQFNYFQQHKTKSF